MLHQGFILAMTADIRLCDYAKPDLVRGKKTEWLLVSRWGDNGEYLCISIAGPRTGAQDEDPAAMRPTLSLVGTLVSNTVRRRWSEFLILRNNVPDVQLAGVFFPADGYARLEGSTSALRLEAVVRYAHVCREENGREMRTQVPQLELASEAMTWQISARRTEWVGNFVA